MNVCMYLCCMYCGWSPAHTASPAASDKAWRRWWFGGTRETQQSTVFSDLWTSPSHIAKFVWPTCEPTPLLQLWATAGWVPGPKLAQTMKTDTLFALVQTWSTYCKNYLTEYQLFDGLVPWPDLTNKLPNVLKRKEKFRTSNPLKIHVIVYYNYK